MMDLDYCQPVKTLEDDATPAEEKILSTIAQQDTTGMPYGYGVKYLQGRWCVVEIRVNPVGEREQYVQEKTFVSVGIAEQEAKGQAVFTHTKYLGEQR